MQIVHARHFSLFNTFFFAFAHTLAHFMIMIFNGTNIECVNETKISSDAEKITKLHSNQPTDKQEDENKAKTTDQQTKNVCTYTLFLIGNKCVNFISVCVGNFFFFLFCAANV